MQNEKFYIMNVTGKASKSNQATLPSPPKKLPQVISQISHIGLEKAGIGR